MPTDRYNGTTKEQRKMARLIAADVLKTMRYLNVRTGAYCTVSDDDLADQDVQSVPLDQLKECRVCARGAMYVSRARLFDVYVFGAVFDDIADTVCESTGNDIGELNAGLIECAFEMRPFHVSWAFDYLGELAVRFGSRYKTDRSRLRAIMRNVIENKGVFRPPVPKAKKVVAK